jgi:hypothetical protein
VEDRRVLWPSRIGRHCHHRVIGGGTPPSGRHRRSVAMAFAATADRVSGPSIPLRFLAAPLAASAGRGGSWAGLLTKGHGGLGAVVGCTDVSGLDDTGWSRGRCSIRRTNTPPGGTPVKRATRPADAQQAVDGFWVVLGADRASGGRWARKSGSGAGGLSETPGAAVGSPTPERGARDNKKWLTSPSAVRRWPRVLRWRPRGE